MSRTPPALRIAPAVVYVGPTLAREVVAAALPGADLRPPVRRGDLHRDRQLRYSLFVIIDGVFLQEEALPPREVIDILEDGAVVLGAASLGALRAAELWPVGMGGSGAIYRLYRRGLLVDEDEVAVLFDPHRPHPPLTAALVDIRWSLREAVRGGTISQPAAHALLEQARRLPFTERTWSRCGCTPVVPGLKERDALLLLRRVRQMVKRDPSVLRRTRRSMRAFPNHQAEREASIDPWAGIQPETEREALGRWLAVHGGTRARACLGEGEAPAGPVPSDLLLRYRAFRDGLAAARSAGLQAEVRHRLAAEAALVRAHGAENWSSLRRNPPIPPGALEEARRDLSLTKALRERLFAPGGWELRLHPP